MWVIKSAHFSDEISRFCLHRATMSIDRWENVFSHNHRKRAVFLFIKDNFDSWDLKRCIDFDSKDVIGESTTIDDWLECQLEAVESLNEVTLTFLEGFISHRISIRLLDKECMCAMRSDGFFFDPKKHIVFSNPR